MPNAFCGQVLLSVCQILCTPWAFPATNSPLSVSNQDALQKPSFPGCRKLFQGIICYILPKASLGLEVMHKELTVLPPMKIGSKGGSRGEVSRQGSGQGSKWCPGYPPGVPFSAQWESSSIVAGFSAVSRDPSMPQPQPETRKMLGMKQLPLVLTLFSPYILWLGLYLLKWAMGDDTNTWKQQVGVQGQPEGPALNRWTPNWVEEDVSLRLK